MEIVKIALLLFFVNSLFAEQIDYYIKDGNKIHLYKVNNSSRDVKDSSLTLYEKGDGKYIGLKDTFFVKIDLMKIVRAMFNVFSSMSGAQIEENSDNEDVSLDEAVKMLNSFF